MSATGEAVWASHTVWSVRGDMWRQHGASTLPSSQRPSTGPVLNSFCLSFLTFLIILSFIPRGFSFVPRVLGSEIALLGKRVTA